MYGEETTYDLTNEDGNDVIEVGEVLPSQPTGNVKAAAAIASNYTDRAVNQMLTLVNTPAAQETLKDLGLQTYIKNVNKEMIIKILAAYGMFSVMRGVKNNMLKIGVAGLGLWLVTKNKERIALAYQNIMQEAPAISPSLPTTIETNIVA